MKEIKFRAWHKKLKHMLPNIQNHIGNSDWAFGFLIKDEKVIVMQFIGLKDKKDKEIFEDDIVRISNVNSGIEGKIFEPFTIVVKYINELAFYNISDYIIENAEFALEVIGNIHQNPELINLG